MKEWCLWSMVILMFMLTTQLKRNQTQAKVDLQAKKKLSMKMIMRDLKTNLFPLVFAALLKKQTIPQNLIPYQTLFSLIKTFTKNLHK